MFSNGVPAGPRRAVAGPNGDFVFRDLPAGSYRLAVEAPGYVDGRYGETRPIPIRRSLDLLRELHLSETDRPAVISIPLWQLGGVSGVVVDEAGEPMVNLNVSVLARMTDWAGPVTQVAATVTTDDRGMYHADVVPGDYVVGVLAATTTAPASAVDNFIRSLEEGGAVRQEYTSGMIAAGGVLPRGVGMRIGDFVVHQIDARNSLALPTFVTIDGRTSFYPTTFAGGAHSAAMARVIPVGAGEEKSGIDIQLRPIPVRRVSGRVTGPAGAAAGLALRLTAADPTVTRTSPATFIDTPRAVTDLTGSFTFIGVAPGNYTLSATRVPRTDTESVSWAAQPVAVGDADVANLELTLQGGVRVSGRVVAESATGAPPPAQLQQIAITARPVPGGPAAMISTTAVRPDATGRFTTRQVIPGTYMMLVGGVPPGWVLKSVTWQGRNVVDQAFEIPGSDIDDVVVTIADRMSIISGMVRSDSTRPVGLATVAIFPADKALWRRPGMASRRVQTAAPDRSGHYAFRGLPAGEYFVIAADWPSADFSDGDVLSKLIPSAVRVQIPDGGSATINLPVVHIR
jgi:hypothetical protein